MSLEDPLSRRAFVGAASGLAAAYVAGGSRARREDGLLVLVGSYTDDAHRDGLHTYRMDPATGALRPVGATDVGPNPSFLALHPNGRALFLVNEVDAFEGHRAGIVSGFALDGATGALTARDRQSSQGAGPAYIALDHSGRYALVANYGGGSVAALPVGGDGRVRRATAVVQHGGSGPNVERQEGPHAHCIVADPSNRYVLATDLGIDRVMVYRFDDRAGTLAPASESHTAVAPGAGPRHLAFHPNGRWLYVANELAITLGAYRWDASAGRLAEIQTLPIVEGARPGPHSAADVHVAPSGRFLYASVRGDNSVAIHAIDASTGRLTPVQRVSTEGDWPRNFGLDPSGRFLLVGNQRSNAITVFRVDTATGRLTFTGQRAEVQSPACIKFYGARG
jgi:6-phosphogluconolactonase